MTPDQAKQLQRRMGVAADGDLGRKSFTALFVKFGAAQARAAELGMAAAVHLEEYEISATPLRLAHFVAQLAHESCGFRYMEEIASGAAYEGRADLGNRIAGDGKRYKGRGPIQLTGRRNYRAYGEMVGIDFENHPEIVAVPSVGLLVACLYWRVNALNALADADDVDRITRRINGGTNGLADRKRHLSAAKGLMT